jgi:hypothetical protein
MVESDEIDVVAVFAEQVVLVECKDTSFGQNDLYVTSVKAQNVGADVVIILSTRDIHQNVRNAIPRIGKSSDEREFLGGVQRDFHLVSDANARAISEELDRILGEISSENMNSWIAGNPYSSAIYRHMPRWD